MGFLEYLMIRKTKLERAERTTFFWVTAVSPCFETNLQISPLVVTILTWFYHEKWSDYGWLLKVFSAVSGTTIAIIKQS